MSDRSNAERFVAVVLTPSPPIVDAAPIISQIARDHPKFAPEDITAQSKTPDNGLVLKVAGAAITLRFVADPLPAGSLQRAAATSIAWRDAASAVAAHRGHVVVAPIGTHTAKTAAPLAAITTAVAAAAASAGDALGVYWASADFLIAPDAFAKGAARVAGGAPAFDLWVKMMPVKGPEGADGAPMTGYVTSGFRTFSGREIEVEPVAMERSRIVGRILAFMGVSLSEPSAVERGARIKVSETEAILATVEETNRFTGAPVFRLRIEPIAEEAAALGDAASPSASDPPPFAPEPAPPPPEASTFHEPAAPREAAPEPILDAAPPETTDDPAAETTPAQARRREPAQAAPPPGGKASGGMLGRLFGKRK